MVCAGGGQHGLEPRGVRVYPAGAPAGAGVRPLLAGPVPPAATDACPDGAPGPAGPGGRQPGQAPQGPAGSGGIRPQRGHGGSTAWTKNQDSSEGICLFIMNKVSPTRIKIGSNTA